MKFFYDFHIHSALSPCADKDNSPYNIVNMAALKGLDVIALTDHNSALNCRAAISAGREKGVLVIPGMELTTNEDVHILCLFDNAVNAEEFGKFVYKDMLKIKNKPHIFGRQYIYGENDNITGEEEMLLTAASNIASYKAAGIAASFGGVAVPAHIDREANGIVSILGGIDGDMGFDTLEISKNARDFNKISIKGYNIIRDSDAHSLYQISEAKEYLELPRLSAEAVINFLKNKTKPL